jgi:hypothetical protein
MHAPSAWARVRRRCARRLRCGAAGALPPAHSSRRSTVQGYTVQGPEEAAPRACSADVASSAALSSRTRTRRGKRMLMPLLGSTRPAAARCTGEMDRSAALTSHTTRASNHTSGTSASPYLPRAARARRRAARRGARAPSDALAQAVMPVRWITAALHVPTLTALTLN